MTNRVNGLFVALDHNLRSDDAQALIEAILMPKGVLSVHSNIVNASSMVAEQRARAELRTKILEMLREEKG